MQDQSLRPIEGFMERLSGYLPTLVAGLLVVVVGIVLGWLVKRAVVRILVWLRLDRLGGRFGWRSAFGKGDVRAALYNVIGGAAMAVVILVFLDNALQIWGLVVLTRLVDNIVFYLPNVALAALIVAVGVLLANLLAVRVEEALDEEEFSHARLVGKILKGVLLAVVGALALWQLDFARQIVLAAFLIGFGAVGVGFALAAGMGSAQAIAKGWETLFEKKDE
ncbi:MAG: hypothetical protein AB7I33_10990 [Gemmatimonadales bacterium]